MRDVPGRVTGKSSAVAHPIQGLVKYHGQRDEALRIPFHDSISVATGPVRTHTTVEFGPALRADEAEIDGKGVSGRPLERVVAVLDAVRARAKVATRARVSSRNDFPSNVGLGASSSGFAALAYAAQDALGLSLTHKEVSILARRGAASAARSVTGGFSRLYAGKGDADTFSEEIPSKLRLGIVSPLVLALKSTEDSHREAPTSPLFAGRLAYLPPVLEAADRAIRKGDLASLCEIAERDTLSLHAVTFTGASAQILWRPQSIAVMHEVRAMRGEGLAAWFSFDTGATGYVNTEPASVPEVERRLRGLGLETLRLEVGGPARTVREHLF
ncbi:MAG: GHMP family kinase ATP-binding protein [Methanobacteriota archaeon]